MIHNGSITPEPSELRDETGWAQLRARLDSLRDLIPDTEGCDVFREYARQVARYSFQSGRVLVAQRIPATDV